mmetsp:Transcript_39719/g.84775  ORF Transcript_39719/g.84775 Transcript_39719/m.84775 type:complete len:234 (+) Transcript_39719:631-1332(+)
MEVADLHVPCLVCANANSLHRQPTAPCEHVGQLVLIELRHGSFHSEFEALFVLVYGEVYFPDRSGGYPWRFRRAVHREGFARACLSVCEDRDVVAVDRRLHQTSAFFKHLILRPWLEDGVEVHLLFADRQSHVVHDGQGFIATARSAHQGAHTTVDPDGALQIRNVIVKASALELRLVQVLLGHSRFLRHMDRVCKASEYHLQSHGAQPVRPCGLVHNASYSCQETLLFLFSL